MSIPYRTFPDYNNYIDEVRDIQPDPISWEDLRHRLGRFAIGRSLLPLAPSHIMRIMSQVIVVRCEMTYQNDCFEYVAMSTLFESSDEGRELPYYKFAYDATTDKITAVKQ